MKEVLSLERIREDLLEHKFMTWKTRRKILNNEFDVIEDLCIENTHKFVHESRLIFSVCRMQRLAAKQFAIPKLKDQYSLCDYLDNICVDHKFYIVHVHGKAEPSLFYDADFCEIDSSVAAKKLVIPQSADDGIKRQLNFDILNKVSSIWAKKDQYSIKICKCVSKDITDCGNENSDDYYAVFRIGGKDVKLMGSYIDDNGKCPSLRLGAFNNCIVGQSYYIVVSNDKPEYIFSKKSWELSKELKLLVK